MAIVVTALLVDTSFGRIYSYNSNNQSVTNQRLAVFSFIAIIYVFAQYFVLEFLKRKTKDIRAKRQLHLKIIHRVVTITQYVITTILAFIISEMIITSTYSILMISAVLVISYTLTLAVLGLLAQRFFSWFKSNKHLVVLLFGLSASMLAINAAFTLGFVEAIFLNTDPYVRSYVGASISPFIAPGSLADLLDIPYVVSSVLSFILSWVSTVLILRHYSPKLRKVKYEIILALPLVFFLVQFLPSFEEAISALTQTYYAFFLYTLFFTFSKPIGGILFGIAFLVIARSLSHRSTVRDYMVLSGYGLLLLFVSNQAVVLVNIIYPPFGLIAVSFMGLSSYLLLLGVYSSAISVSEDSKLRQSIKQFALSEPKLLDSIGTSHMEQEIQKKVLVLTKLNRDRMAEETGIQTSMSDDDMKLYLQEVIEEVKKDKFYANDGKN